MHPVERRRANTEMTAKSGSKDRQDGERPLPKPNATFVSNDAVGEMTPDKIRGIACNPVYAGVGPYPADRQRGAVGPRGREDDREGRSRAVPREPSPHTTPDIPDL